MGAAHRRLGTGVRRAAPPIRRFLRIPGWLAVGSLLAVALAFPKAAAGQPSEPIDVGFEVVSLAYSPDGAQLAASGASGHAHLYDAATGDLKFELSIPFPQQNIERQEADQRCDHVVFSPDGKQLAGLFNGEWDFVRGPDNQRINFYGLTRGIVVWNTITGKTYKIYELGRRVGMVPDGTKKVAGAGAGGALDDGLTRAEGTRTIAFVDGGQRMIGDLGNMWRIGVGDDGALNEGQDPVVFVAAAGEEGDRVTVSPKGIVRFWDYRDRLAGQAKCKPPIRVGRNGQTSLRSIAMSGDGARLALGVIDGVRLFDVAERKAQRPIRIRGRKPGPVLAVAFSPDGAQLATGHASGAVKVWDVESREELREWAPAKGEELPAARAVAFVPAGDRLAVARGTEIEFLEVAEDTATGDE